MEPQDALLLHQWENRAEEWWLGAQLAPISMEAMQRFAALQHASLLMPATAGNTRMQACNTPFCRGPSEDEAR